MNEQPTSDSPIEVFLDAKHVDAQGIFDGTGVTVLAGSKGRGEPVPSLQETFHKRREELFKADVIGRVGENIVFNADQHFASPSGAAMIVLGSHTNGWMSWKTADGSPLDVFRKTQVTPEERTLERRWFDVHRVAFEADDVWPAIQQEHEQSRDGGADEALSFVTTLKNNRDAAAFAASMQQWAVVDQSSRAFNGFSGQMLLNQLVKHSDATDLAAVLIDVLPTPADADDAGRKIQRLVDHIEEIRVGAHPAPGHAPFFLSYFWALADHATWPVIWTSAAAFAEFITAQSLPPAPADRYEAYLDFMELIDASNEQIEWIGAWWAEERPVLLADVLVDRCQYGLDSRELPMKVQQQNEDALITTANHIATQLVDVVSAAAGRSLTAVRPPKGWKANTPRADFWANWRAVDNGPAIRLWVTHAGAGIGIVPGVVRSGWIEEVNQLVDAAQIAGFERVSTRGTDGDERGRIAAGRSGEFLYGKWFNPEQLADLDVEREVTAVAVSLQPLLDEMVRRATGIEDDDIEDPLKPAVEKFRTIYPSSKDGQQLADRAEFAATLAPDAIALADPVDLRRIWNTQRYGGTGPQSILNSSIRDADSDAAEYDRIIDTLRYVCWGDGDDAERIDEVLDTGGSRYVKGLGESVIMKLLAVCHPDRYLPVFPFSGPKGKRRMLQELGLPEPTSQTRGAIQVEANNHLRERLHKFFPGDAWGMAQFLYRYTDGLSDPQPSGDIDLDIDPIEELAAELLVDRSFLDDIIALLSDKRQVILYGPPGTGKTYLAQKLAEALVPDPTRRSLVQFHPSTSYEDFFEGYRPETSLNGDLSYRLTPGPLALLAARAADAPGKRHLMIIDEINRANLPRVLGELLFLLEYRNTQVPTLYRPDDPFELPEDLWFIGTMNTADRSIALVDAALRRRFHFIPFFPNKGPMSGLLDRWLAKHEEPAWVGELLAMVNDQLTEALNGPHLQIGPSYFMKSKLDQQAVRLIWEYNIEPFIEDQFFGDPSQIERFRFPAVLEAYLSSVDVASLGELEAARAADVGASSKPVNELTLSDGSSSQLTLDNEPDINGGQEPIG